MTLFSCFDGVRDWDVLFIWILILVSFVYCIRLCGWLGVLQVAQIRTISFWRIINSRHLAIGICFLFFWSIVPFLDAYLDVWKQRLVLSGGGCFFVRSHIVVNLDGFENLMYLTCTIFVVIHVLIPILVVWNGLKDFGARAQDEVAVPVLFTSRAQVLQILDELSSSPFFQLGLSSTVKLSLHLNE